MKKFALKMIMSVSVIAFSLTSISCSNESLEDSTATGTNANSLTLEEAEKLQNPSLKDGDVYTIKKYIFSRSKGAGRLGHVGVAFELRATIGGVNYISFYEGGIEGTNGWFGIPNAFTPLGGNNGGWSNQVSTRDQMINEFKARRYNRYKFGVAFVSTTAATSNYAKGLLAFFPSRGYNVAGNNCMNASYDVIASFSENNGNPSVPNQYLPNSWYDGLTVASGWGNSISM